MPFLDNFNNTTNNRQQFLDNLKVGDVVAAPTRLLVRDFVSTYGFEEHTITRITPSRAKIETETKSGTYVFNKEGFFKQGSGYRISHVRMEPMTDDIRAQMRKDALFIKFRTRRDMITANMTSNINKIAAISSNTEEEVLTSFLEATEALAKWLETHK